ncbi:hypothetical protein IF2G_05684 [Cordyceps javanica]|nr:hypothetical protein IF2G_05684 [Cordyceps javanica]
MSVHPKQAGRDGSPDRDGLFDRACITGGAKAPALFFLSGNKCGETVFERGVVQTRNASQALFSCNQGSCPSYVVGSSQSRDPIAAKPCSMARLVGQPATSIACIQSYLEEESRTLS